MKTRPVEWGGSSSVIMLDKCLYKFILVINNEKLNMETTTIQPTPTYYSREKIFTIAEEWAITNNYKPGNDLVTLVKQLNGEIEYVNFDSWYSDDPSGSIIVRPDGFTIYIPNFTPPLRDRFTIAHELGHFFLHAECGKKPIHVNRHGKGKLETEANYFGAAFLMPSTYFRESDIELDGDDSAMASRFLVSEAAIRVRRETLR